MMCNEVKVARAPILVCLQCPLCCNLVHEATTISECLHTFCRSCIYQLLGDGENDYCPICNVSLGCSPLEKLRPDHQLDDVCAKLFPVKANIHDNTDVDGPLPGRRKERSLASLGIGAASSSNPGFVSRHTKSISRRSQTFRDTSTDDELESKQAEPYNVKKVLDGDLQEKSSFNDKVLFGDLSDSHEVETLSKKEAVFGDEQNANELNIHQLPSKEQGATGRKGIFPEWSKEPSKVPPPLGNADSSKLENFLSEQCNMSTSGLLKSQISEATNSSDRLIHKRPANVNNYLQLPAANLTESERLDKNLINQSPLAHLAAVAVDQAGQTEYLDLPKARGPRAHRGRGKNESAKSSAMGGSLSWQTMLENIRSAAALPEKKQKPKTPSPAKTLPPPKKPPIFCSTNKHVQTPALVTKVEKANVGFWFSLEAADHEFAENALPQVSRRYLRIKDGKLPVSSVKKYLVKKLDLQSEAEVEITCRGQPVVPNLPLEKVQGIWLATTPSSMELLPALKDMNSAPQDSTTWAQYKGRSAQDYMMVLTYSRHRRQLVAL